MKKKNLYSKILPGDLPKSSELMERNNHEKYLIFHLLEILQPGMSQNSTGNGRFVNEFGLKMDKIGPKMDEM